MNKKDNTAKYIIVGAGLSGLTSAYYLNKQSETNFFVLESRTRIGGRIKTENNIDLGATWFQKFHQNVHTLIDDLSLNKFCQYTEGKGVLVYDLKSPAHYFENNPDVPSSYRISGGSASIINNLADVVTDNIKTNTSVLEIIETSDGVTLVTNTGNYYAKKVIVTIPPNIATRISYTPELESTTISAMENTHTWMSNAIKVGLTFNTAFWRKKNMSGTLISEVGPVTELYDHSSCDNKLFSLMGFVNENLRNVSATERKQNILTYLKTYFGEEILNYTSYKEKDWSKDKNTSREQIKPLYLKPKYGNPIFSKFHLNGKLLFSGTETSPVYGGYLDGAIYSGITSANKLLKSK